MHDNTRTTSQQNQSTIKASTTTKDLEHGHEREGSPFQIGRAGSMDMSEKSIPQAA
jgi:hypothetical protein